MGTGGLSPTLCTTNHLLICHGMRLQPEKLTGRGHFTLAACAGAPSKNILRTWLPYTRLGSQRGAGVPGYGVIGFPVRVGLLYIISLSPGAVRATNARRPRLSNCQVGCLTELPLELGQTYTLTASHSPRSYAIALTALGVSL